MTPTKRAPTRNPKSATDSGPAPEPEIYDHHGGGRPRGMAHAPGSSLTEGRFGRMFPALQAFEPTDDVLEALAASMSGPPGPAQPVPPTRNNHNIPAGYTYFGQFIDHDITFDPASSLERRNDPDALRTFRTPRFDLDSLYGSGRNGTPFLYDQEDPVKLLVGHNEGKIFEPIDVPRNEQGRALVGDPRNDVHVIISQLHLAFIRFHNAAVDHLRSKFFPEPELFEEARRLTCWHYQWIVVHDYVSRLIGPELLDQILVPDPATGGSTVELRFFKWTAQPYIPVEFSAAAYRFGHSQARATYQLNDKLKALPVFPEALVAHPESHLGGFRRLPKNWTVLWSGFFVIEGSQPHPSARIDTRIAEPLGHLPEAIDKDRRSLALLNMLRGRSLGLPSGQAVAEAMGTATPNADLNLDGETPLWYYLLRESEVVADGLHLGPTGGRIVAEVLLGLLHADPESYLRRAPTWKPELPAENEGEFTMPDFLRFAGVPLGLD